MTKITKREYFEAIIEAMETGEIKLDPKDVANFCRHEIELINAKNEKAKERAAAKAKEADALQEKVLAALSDELESIADIAAKIGDEEATVSKVQYRLNNLVKEGTAVKGEITIPKTETSKARKVVAFALAQAN